MAGIFDIKLKDKDIKDGKVPGFSQKDKEGSFVGAGPLGPEGSKINRNRIGPPVKRRRVYVIATICLIVVLLILSYVIYLQVFKGSYFRNIAEGNRIRTVPVIAKRGLIYDKEERPLTKNRANFSLIIVPGDIPGEKELRQELKDKLILNLEKIFSSIKDILIEFNIELVMFSPASTSWDSYSSFEVRGDHFRKLVKDLNNKELI